MTQPKRRYYFASRYSRHPELAGYRDELLAAIPGAAVTSRWIDRHGGALAESIAPATLNDDPAGCWEFGRDDLADLYFADTLVSFTGEGGKGGRHIEHGYALGLDMRVVIVGRRENIFHCEPGTEVYSTWGDFLDFETEIGNA